MVRLLISFVAASVAWSAAAQEASVMTSPDGVEDTVVVEESEAANTNVGAEPDAGNPPALLVVDAAEVTLDDFLWTNRPVVVFADTPADPRFREQLALLTSRPEPLIARDVVVITDTDPDGDSAVRTRLRPRGFQLTLIGKDGSVNLRKPLPWDVREITRAIDKWPLRQEEIRADGIGG